MNPIFLLGLGGLGAAFAAIGTSVRSSRNREKDRLNLIDKAKTIGVANPELISDIQELKQAIQKRYQLLNRFRRLVSQAEALNLKATIPEEDLTNFGYNHWSNILMRFEALLEKLNHSTHGITLPCIEMTEEEFEKLQDWVSFHLKWSAQIESENYNLPTHLRVVLPKHQYTPIELQHVIHNLKSLQDGWRVTQFWVFLSVFVLWCAPLLLLLL